MDKEYNEIAKFILSLWGALLSTLLAVFAFIKFKRESESPLVIEASINDKESIDNWILNLCNTSTTPIVVTSFSIGYGTAKDYQNVLYEEKTQLTLANSQPCDININKSTVISNLSQMIKNKLIKDEKALMYSRLWINVKLSNRKLIQNVIFIKPELFGININPKYDQYIATGRFLGFDYIEKYNEGFIRRSKYHKF